MRLVRRCVLGWAAAVLAVAGAGLPRAAADPAAADRPSAAADQQDSGPQAVSAAGSFYPTDIRRLLGTTTSGYAVAAGAGVTVPVVGQQGLPTGGLSAALVNVTATASTADAGLTAFPSGGPAPAMSLLSVPAGATRSALLTVPLGTVGAFDLLDSGSGATVTVDILGFYAADNTVIASRGVGGGYQPVMPTRLFDSAKTAPGGGARPTGPLPAQGSTRLSVDLGAAVNGHVTALALQVSAVAPTANGSLTVWAGSQLPDLTSVAFSAGAPATNLAVVPTPAGGGLLELSLANRGPAQVDVTVDLVGFYDDGSLGPNLRLRPLTPTRVVDSRAGIGTSSRVTGRAATVLLPESVAGTNSFGLVGVLTAVAPSTPSQLVLAPDGSPASRGPSRSGGSGEADAGAIRVAAGALTSTPVQVELGPGNRLALGNAAVSTDVLLDVTGSWEAYPPVTDPSTKGWVRAVPSWQVTVVAR